MNSIKSNDLYNNIENMCNELMFKLMDKGYSYSLGVFDLDRIIIQNLSGYSSDRVSAFYLDVTKDDYSRYRNIQNDLKNEKEDVIMVINNNCKLEVSRVNDDIVKYVKYENDKKINTLILKFIPHSYHMEYILAV